MHLPVPTGYIELMGVHPEWNARDHKWKRLFGSIWQLDIVMKDDGFNGGRPQNPRVPLSVIFDSSWPADWLSVRVKIYYMLRDLKQHLRR